MSWSPSSPAVALLATLVEERTGLHYGPQDRELFVDKASPRAVEAGFETSLDYYYFLRYDDADGAELRALVDTLVVNETYFFRELAPLEVLADELVLPLVHAGKRVRIWSAACSTGEEPMTLAMVLASRGLLSSVELVASDISTKALDRARRDEHSVRAIRSDPPAAYSHYLLREGARTRVSPQIRDAIDFRQVNLTDAEQVKRLGFFDVVLCRNALIYFRDDTVAAVVDHLTATLTTGGALVVSISESLLRVSTSLTCEERSGVFLYRKAP